MSSHSSANLTPNTGDRSKAESPVALRRKIDQLIGKQQEKQNRSEQLEKRLGELESYLQLAGPVTEALKNLGEQLFESELKLVQEKLTIALQDVLQQPISFRARADFKRGAAVVEFSIDREGNTEDIQRGQGGSVQNVLSVGLRMFALATLNRSDHRPFLVLDEQDCWLRPELVPKLVSIVEAAGRELGFQVLMISHHDLALFDRYADQILRLEQEGSVDRVRKVKALPGEPDQNIS